jgi:hypothetical protein
MRSTCKAAASHLRRRIEYGCSAAHVGWKGRRGEGGKLRNENQTLHTGGGCAAQLRSRSAPGPGILASRIGSDI